MFSEPAGGERPVHAIQCEWVLSGARGKDGSVRVSEPRLSRYREAISSGREGGSYRQRWKTSFSELGWHRESIVPCVEDRFFYFLRAPYRFLRALYRRSPAESAPRSGGFSFQTSSFHLIFPRRKKRPRAGKDGAGIVRKIYGRYCKQ